MASISTADVMSVDSNDTDISLITSNDDNDKPLMMLFKRLIGNDSKQNTVLTNAQIVDILKKEFLMDISYIHDLEIEIYLNLMKKFLKDWPEWDEFDQKIQSMKTQMVTDEKCKKLELETNYENLKEYLSKMLGMAKPIIKTAVDEVKEIVAKENPKRDSDVLLEVSCSREQLNELFYRRPHPDFNNTIFKVNISSPKIRVISQSLNSIFNWPNVQIIVNLSSIVIKRETGPITKRRLVNKKLNNLKAIPEEMNVNLQMKVTSAETKHTIRDLFNILSKPIFPPVEIPTVKALTEVLQADLSCKLDTKVPASFRKTLNKYPYVRYLYSEVDTKKVEHVSSYGYDLKLEETFVPKVTLQIVKFDKYIVKYNDQWLQVKCLECNAHLMDIDCKSHFEEYHQGEPNWECTNCKQSFDMVQLSACGWKHDC